MSGEVAEVVSHRHRKTSVFHSRSFSGDPSCFFWKRVEKIDSRRKYAIAYPQILGPFFNFTLVQFMSFGINLFGGGNREKGVFSLHRKTEMQRRLKWVWLHSRSWGTWLPTTLNPIPLQLEWIEKERSKRRRWFSKEKIGNILGTKGAGVWIQKGIW